MGKHIGAAVGYEILFRDWREQVKAEDIDAAIRRVFDGRNPPRLYDADTGQDAYAIVVASGPMTPEQVQGAWEHGRDGRSDQPLTPEADVEIWELQYTGRFGACQPDLGHAPVSATAQRLLADGWEPFAVTDEYIWFRRRRQDAVPAGQP